MAITVDKYTALSVEEYNGTYSVKEGWINKDGEFKPNFAKRRFKKDGEEKNAPVSIRLGTKDVAIDNLRALYEEISGEQCPF
jgi:hypothetical protein